MNIGMSKKILSNETELSVSDAWAESIGRIQFVFILSVIVGGAVMLWSLIYPFFSAVSEKDALRNTTTLSSQTQLSGNKETILIGDTVYLYNNKQKYKRIE